MFNNLTELPTDPILGLAAAFRADERVNKVDLSVGVFKNEKGETPIFEAVKKAEAYRVETETTKAYIGMTGQDGYNSLLLAEALGASHPVIAEGRVASTLTPGGCGALHMIAQMIKRSNAKAKVWVSDPTWANHIPLIGGVGIEIETYPYFDRATHGVNFDAMLSQLNKLGADDIVLLHACCHNPTGADLSEAQWDQLAESAAKNGWIPFIDSAYQGLGTSLEADGYGMRTMAKAVPQMFLALSCSKNFGLYRDRVGLAAVITDKTNVNAVLSHVKVVGRGIWSMPPAHGGAIVEKILSTPTLRDSWVSELEDICSTVNTNRQLLAQALTGAGIPGDFGYLTENQGMFSFLDLSKDQINRLREEHAVYIVGSGRINIAGAHKGNVDLIAEAIKAVF
ncbi:amino acid aminotransferase [Temperatibacter marinus]|uniref:Aminotransferase n=1 Tax=Temperatibacter marinus TaxID=1456591 RepID=A0AA52EEV6_9PROT|nr:amino acid aminotransferase [Temperatibacter marinus]WND03435.1 amino acid aminotransferase [Temperatibacter marinus]